MKKVGKNMQKQMQMGWEFKGTDIVSKDYTRLHYFAGETANRGYVSRYSRGYSHDEENMFEVSVRTTRYKHTEELPKKFEVLCITKLGGKIVETKFLPAEPYYEEVEVVEEESEETI